MEEHKPQLIVANLLTDEDVSKLKVIAKDKHYALLYVMPKILSYYTPYPTVIALEQRFYQQAKARLAELSEELNIADSQCFIRQGNLRWEVARFIKEYEMDLYVTSAVKQELTDPFNTVALAKLTTSIKRCHRYLGVVIDRVREVAHN